MKKRKKKGDVSAEEMFSEPSPPVTRITPEDIQQKEFGAARMGGYRHHEVDEFLDELTRAMGELIEENERLRAAEGSAAPSPAAPTASTAGAGPGGAAGLQPFLERERDFLRALGELVQGHMEQVRAMARGATGERDAGEAVAGSPAVEPAPSEPSGSSEAGTGRLAMRAPSEPPAAAPPAAPPTEPVHLVESEPAVAGRTEDGGLRELFWGEDD